MMSMVTKPDSPVVHASGCASTREPLSWLEGRRVAGGAGAQPGGRDPGFSLIELLIVIVVLGILGGIVVFGVGRFRGDAALAADMANLKQLNNASAAYQTTAVKGMGLSDQASDADRMKLLFERGLLQPEAEGSDSVTAQVAGAAFSWDEATGKWVYTSGTDQAAQTQTSEQPAAKDWAAPTKAALESAGAAMTAAMATTGLWSSTVPSSVEVPEGIVLDVVKGGPPADTALANFAAFLAACSSRSPDTGSCAYLAPSGTYPQGVVEYKVQYRANEGPFGPYRILPGQSAPDKDVSALQMAKIKALGYTGGTFTVPTEYNASPAGTACVVGHPAEDSTALWHWDSASGVVSAGGC